MTLQSNGYFRKWKITFDGYFAFGGITSFGDLEKNKHRRKGHENPYGGVICNKW